MMGYSTSPRVLMVVLTLFVCQVGAVSESERIKTEVSEAFAAVREGNLSLTSGLVHYGDQVVAHLAPLVNDNDKAVRIEVVALLGALESETGAKAIVPFLSDPEDDIRERGAGAVYRFVAREGAVIDFESQLLSGVEKGRPGAAALLLLGYCEGGEEALVKYESDERLVRLAQGGPVVPTELPATVALSLLGDGEARTRLIAAIDDGKLQTLMFLLDAVTSVDSPEVLHVLADKTLTDAREVHSGVPVGAVPARRLGDVAVEVFVNRLNLKPRFEIDTSRCYKDEEIAQIRALIRDAIPR